MENQKAADAVIEVSEIISPKIYYFYAEPDRRYRLEATAVVAIALLLIGAFLDGFIGYLTGEIRELGQHTAKQLWQAVQLKLGRTAWNRQEKLLGLLDKAKDVMTHHTEDEIKASIAHTKETLALILEYNGYSAEDAREDAERIVSVIERLSILGREVWSVYILFLAANPVDTPRVRLDKEIREIEQRLRESDLRDKFVIKSHLATRHIDLSQVLLRYKPHIVHFSGHGSEDGALILEDNQGKAHPVSAEVLAKLFRILKDNVRCVVLNACWTTEQARAITQEIDCVVGMSKAIGDEAAISFARGFYQALGFGRNVQEAFDLGCIEIDLANIPEYATPKLLTKLGVNAADVVFA